MSLETYEGLNSHVICAAGVQIAAMSGTHVPLGVPVACRAKYAGRMPPADRSQSAARSCCDGGCTSAGWDGRDNLGIKLNPRLLCSYIATSGGYIDHALHTGGGCIVNPIHNGMANQGDKDAESVTLA